MKREKDQVVVDDCIQWWLGRESVTGWLGGPCLTEIRAQSLGCEGMRNFPLRSIQEKQDFERSSKDGIFVSSPKFMLSSNPQYDGTKAIIRSWGWIPYKWG